VYFTNEGKQRPSAEAALQYPFLAPAFNPNLTPEELAEGTLSGSGSRSWLGLFSLVQNRVTDLEDEITKTVRCRVFEPAALIVLCTLDAVAQPAGHSYSCYACVCW
jgi:hypothetical protein